MLAMLYTHVTKLVRGYMSYISCHIAFTIYKSEQSYNDALNEALRNQTPSHQDEKSLTIAPVHKAHVLTHNVTTKTLLNHYTRNQHTPHLQPQINNPIQLHSSNIESHLLTLIHKPISNTKITDTTSTHLFHIHTTYIKLHLQHYVHNYSFYPLSI